jgi:hypothetical protein
MLHGASEKSLHPRRSKPLGSRLETVTQRLLHWLAVGVSAGMVLDVDLVDGN